MSWTVMKAIVVKDVTAVRRSKAVVIPMLAVPAILMIVLPPSILVFFSLRDPQYVQNLLNSSWGRNATVLAFVLEIIGVVWVMRILKNSQGT